MLLMLQYDKNLALSLFLITQKPLTDKKTFSSESQYNKSLGTSNQAIGYIHHTTEMSQNMRTMSFNYKSAS